MRWGANVNLEFPVNRTLFNEVIMLLVLGVVRFVLVFLVYPPAILFYPSAILFVPILANHGTKSEPPSNSLSNWALLALFWSWIVLPCFVNWTATLLHFATPWTPSMDGPGFHLNPTGSA